MLLAAGRAVGHAVISPTSDIVRTAHFTKVFASENNLLGRVLSHYCWVARRRMFLVASHASGAAIILPDSKAIGTVHLVAELAFGSIRPDFFSSHCHFRSTGWGMSLIASQTPGSAATLPNSEAIRAVHLFAKLAFGNDR